MLLRARTRWAVLAVLVTALLLILSSTAVAVPIVSPTGPPIALYPHSKPIAKMTLREKETFQEHALQHYRSVVRAFLSWRKANLVSAEALTSRTMTGAAFLPHCKALGIAAPANVCWYAAATRWTTRELTKTQLKIKALEAWPAHHSLWLCIHGSEGAWDDPNSGNNGHYGGLQMHPGWGHGTAYYANQSSQLVQERAAEDAYVKSGYDPHFLTQQWGQTIGPCWSYAARM